MLEKEVVAALLLAMVLKLSVELALASACLTLPALELRNGGRVVGNDRLEIVELAHQEHQVEIGPVV